MAKSISNMDDIIDSRDIVERYNELREKLSNGVTSRGPSFVQEEVDELEKLIRQGEDIDDWDYGVTLVRDSYFRDYAADLAEDIGAIDRNAEWPNNCIDWDKAARELRMDYTPIDFDGVTYWVR